MNNPISAEAQNNGHQNRKSADRQPDGQPDIQFEAAGIRRGDRLLWSNLSLNVQQGDSSRFWDQTGRESQRCSR